MNRQICLSRYLSIDDLTSFSLLSYLIPFLFFVIPFLISIQSITQPVNETTLRPLSLSLSKKNSVCDSTNTNIYFVHMKKTKKRTCKCKKEFFMRKSRV